MPCAKLFAAAGFCLLVTPFASAITPDNPGAGDVAFTIDATSGGQAISPKIYGVNGSLRPSGLTGARLGGNRWTGYNWETNNSNAGSDFFHYNDGNLVNRFPNPNSPPGDAVRPTLQDMASRGGYTNVTVPMAGYVSADDDQEVFPSQTAPSSRWHELRNRKSSVYPGSSLSLSPNLNDNFVFTDEFINWVESSRVGGQEVLYTLDNEPGLWSETHPRLFGTTGVTFAELGQKSIETASTIKDVAPDAKVLGGVTFGWSAMQSLQGAPDFNQQVPPQERTQRGLHFNRWLLETLAAEEQQQGRVLMDALDIHWYPEARGGGVRITAGGAFNNSPAVVEARVQAPRSLWDPTYIEDSWIANDILRDYSGQGNDEGVELLNRVRDDIDELKPGTLISVSEYNYGGGNHISGGIAQADVLGIFGREGVYNASWWPIEGSNSAYVEGAFEMFTDFDGLGSRFGDLSLEAGTDDDSQSSIYASRSTDNPDEMILVAINRTGSALDAAIQISDDQAYESAEVYQLTGSSSTPTSAGSFSIDLVNAFVYEMPAYSVSTIRLVAAPSLPGDANGDGTVDLLDLDILGANFGATDATVAQGDFNGDTVVDLLDLDILGANFGQSSSEAVPEPTSLLTAGVAVMLLGPVRRRTAPE